MVIGMKNKIVAGIQRVSNFASVAGMFTMLIMMVITTADVLGRSIFKAPILGAYELTEFMLVIVVLLGFGYTQQINGNARITFFVDWLGPRWQTRLDELVTFFSLIFFLVITGGALRETLHSYHAGEVSDLLRIPQWPFKLLVPLGLFLLSLELLIRLVASLSQSSEHDRSRSPQHESH